MDIPSLLLFVLFIVHLGEGLSNGCSEELRCGKDGPAIRFPFRLKDTQPDHCGYPGFDLSCTDQNDTVLQLPTSVKVSIKDIDYKSQLIQVSDPHNCFPRHIRGLNLSSSPFEFNEIYPFDYFIFNCTRTSTANYLVGCLSNTRYSVYANSLSLELKWSKPMCRHCEVKGKKCRLKNNSTEIKPSASTSPKILEVLYCILLNFHFFNHTSSFTFQANMH
ncbi:rust resistance kinase Lr10-like isoform X1 [Fagus crenata]